MSAAIRWSMGVFSATALALVLPLVACGRGAAGGGSEPPRTASVQLSEQWASGGAVTCTASLVTWRLDPISLTGRDGQATAYQSTRSYQVFAQGETCVITESVLGLRPGVWRASVSSGSTSSCDVELAAGGGNSVRFTSYESGCRSGS